MIARHDGGCYWHLVGRSQGGWATSHCAQDSPTKKHPAQLSTVHSLRNPALEQEPREDSSFLFTTAPSTGTEPGVQQATAGVSRGRRGDDFAGEAVGRGVMSTPAGREEAAPGLESPRGRTLPGLLPRLCPQGWEEGPASTERKGLRRGGALGVRACSRPP